MNLPRRLRWAKPSSVNATSIRVLALVFGLLVLPAGYVAAAPAVNLWRDVTTPAPPADPGAEWVAVADQRSGQGRFAAAAAACVAAIAAGSPTASVQIRLGDVLMADGELAGAQAAYREAIAVASVPAPGGDREPGHLAVDDPRARTQDLALARIGLAAALDRAGDGEAARQMVREALAADATASVLDIATMPDTDVRIVPEGEVFYRIGVVRQALGRHTDATAAFREYLERLPGARWAEAAQGHVAELEGREGGGRPAPDRRPARGPAPRVLAAATVLATGGTPAPLIDAAWRDQAVILDDCLERAGALVRPGAPLRLAIEMEIDRRGRVVAATAKLPADAAPLARCLEDAVRAGLHVPAPAGGRPTRARTELLVGFSR